LNDCAQESGSAKFSAEIHTLKAEALRQGFRHVESGPLVRSSYHAHEQATSTGLTAATPIR
jgi:lipoate synthase